MISGALVKIIMQLDPGSIRSSLFEARTLKSLFFDTMFKYNGWAASAAYMSRMTDNAITVNR
jgi:hypothetical protein